MADIFHEIKSDILITAERAAEIAAENRWWGYHPGGYGGYVYDRNKRIIPAAEYSTTVDTQFFWGHMDSCD